MKKCLFLICLIAGCLAIQAQYTAHYLLHTGYTLQKNTHYGELGAGILLLKTDDVVWRGQAGVQLGSKGGKAQILPKAQADVLLNFRKNADLRHSYYFLAGSEFTTEYAAPKAGISLFGLLDLTAGYGFAYTEKNRENYNGLNIGLKLHLPIVVLQELRKK